MPSLTPNELPPAPPAKSGWPWTDEADASSEASPWPRISIVTPSLNQGAFIEAAIRSVLLQAYPRVELIVVDGGSTDGSVDTIAKYAPWLAHSICERDSGPANALNKGFRRATGEILGFLNADDFLLPGCLATVAREFWMHPGVDVVSGHGFMAKASGELATPIFSDRWNVKKFVYDACVLIQPATFFRRRTFQQVDGFKETPQTTWDMELWADMALAGATFHSVDEFLAAHRVHTASISGSPHLMKQRRQDARAIRQKMKGRRETLRDRIYSLVHRVGKFSGHPRRTLSQRMFFYSTLNRWSL